MKTLNILQIYDYMKLGGAESHIITLSKALRDRGHNVCVASSAGPAVNILSRLSIPFYEIDPPEKLNLMDNAGKILEIIDRNQIDIIHVHPFQSQILATLVKLVRDIPIVTTVHGAYFTPGATGLVRLIDHYIFVSPEVRDFHVDNSLLHNKTYDVVPNCVEIEKGKNNFEITGDPLRVSYISRLDGDKLPSILFFIESIEKIAMHMNIEVKIIGSGTEYNAILERAAQLNTKLSKEIITVINGSDNVKEYMKKSDVVVGVGRVVLEALALGKIPVCIGNQNYVGIVNKQKLEVISKVNYTDRNTDTPLDSKLLLNDLQRIVDNDDQFKKEIVEAYEFIRQNNDVRLSAREHERIYTEIIRDYQGNKGDLLDLKGFRSEFAEIDSIFLALETTLKGMSYQLDTPKSKRVLLKPDFNDSTDKWIEALTYLAQNFDCRSTTIVIRISNEFNHKAQDILETIDTVFNSLCKNFELDVLVDTLYQDEVYENLFLLEINYFVPTNRNQRKIIYKAELLECRILRLFHDI